MDLLNILLEWGYHLPYHQGRERGENQFLLYSLINSLMDFFRILDSLLNYTMNFMRTISLI